MNRLQSELCRLYLPPGAESPQGDATELALSGHDGEQRAAVLELARPADWPALSAVWQGVQADLGLPAPAIAINGLDGYQLWFSWTQPLPLEQAQAFLRALCERYLPGVPARRLRLLPQPGQGVAQVPALRPDTGLWSAFVAPDLAAVFGDEPAIDLPPGPDAQADVLARLSSMRPGDMLQAWERLQPVPAPQAPETPAAPYPASPPACNQAAAGPGPGLSPQAFLRAVMDAPSVPLALRIEAAKALLAAGPSPG
jgi:hypothetical protein